VLSPRTYDASTVRDDVDLTNRRRLAPTEIRRELSMAPEESPATAKPVTVMCFTFHNPLSINGPFGTFQLWVEDDNVHGRMTYQTLFGLGSTILLNLRGSRNNANPVIYTLEGVGVATQRLDSFYKPVFVASGVTVHLDSSGSQGELIFTSAAPSELSGGLPVKSVTCPPPAGDVSSATSASPANP
jgi:hypothetical protein